MIERMTLDEYLDRYGVGFPCAGTSLDKCRFPHGLSKRQHQKMMQDTLDEVTATESSDYSEENRLSVIEAMQTAIDHMKDYTAAVKNGESDLTDYTHSFENDFNALTGLASLYNQ